MNLQMHVQYFPPLLLFSLGCFWVVCVASVMLVVASLLSGLESTLPASHPECWCNRSSAQGFARVLGFLLLPPLEKGTYQLIGQLTLPTVNQALSLWCLMYLFYACPFLRELSFMEASCDKISYLFFCHSHS